MAWHEAGAFATPHMANGSKGCYVFPVPPFTSGSAHMGHIRSYTLGDTYARFRRALGDAVLFSLGFDAFGLPAELGAIKAGIPPAQWVSECADRMRQQFTSMGYSFDWDRTFNTCEPNFYKWSQWLFVTLMKLDLVYQDEIAVDWCGSCNTVLARLQVEEGACSRCHGPVSLVRRTQWFVRMSRYLDENYNKLADLDKWDKLALGEQRAALGRVDGAEVDASTADGLTVTAFTPHPEAIPDAAFVALSPRHPELEQWMTTDHIREQVMSLRGAGLQRQDREAGAMPAVDLERQVTIRGVPRMLPVVVSPTVDGRFGATAIIGLPQMDASDAAIAAALATRPAPSWRIANDGTVSARPAARYSAGDFPVSRQRGWGAPIPVIYCPDCGTIPVPVADLPVKLPEDLRVTGSGNALADHPTFADCECPGCGGKARRATDTLDYNFDGLWVWMPACVPRADRPDMMFTHPELASWIPVEMVVWGADGGIYMANERTCVKMLRDAGVFGDVNDGEPYERAVMHEMVCFDGRKMSKHIGNVVKPDELVKEVGADTVRFAIAYMAAPRSVINWSEKDISYCHRFLVRLWRYTRPRLARATVAGDESQPSRPDPLRRKLEKWCKAAVSKITADFTTLQAHRATRNIAMLLARIEDFEKRVVDERGALDEQDQEAVRNALLLLVRLSAPLVPHIAEELWRVAGNDSFVYSEPWPQVDDVKSIQSRVERV